MNLVHHSIEHFCKIIIQAYIDYSALIAGLINHLLDIFCLVNHFSTSIVNYEAIYKPIKESYLDKNKDDKLYFTDYQYYKSKFYYQNLCYYRKKRIKKIEIDEI